MVPQHLQRVPGGLAAGPAAVAAGAPGARTRPHGNRPLQREVCAELLSRPGAAGTPNSSRRIPSKANCIAHHAVAATLSA